MLEEFTSPAITRDIEMLIMNMVNIIKEVSGYNTNISSMTLFFKVDHKHRIWFLYCSRISIRTSVDDPWFRDLFRSAAGTREESPVFRYTVFNKVMEIEELEKTLQMKSNLRSKIYETNPNQQNCSICLSRIR